MKPNEWLILAQRLRAISQNGLAYCQNDYDRERYEDIAEISLQMLANLSNVPMEALIRLLPSEFGYETPKVDVRAVIVRDQDQILMVQERIDQNRWSLPGGWADVGYTPFEVAEKEVLEETGLKVEAVRLLAVFDKKRHDHPPQPWYVYKFFILCRVVSGKLANETIETTGCSWVDKKRLADLALSTDRVTLSQLKTIVRLTSGEIFYPLCD